MHWICYSKNEQEVREFSDSATWRTPQFTSKITFRVGVNDEHVQVGWLWGLAGEGGGMTNQHEPSN